THQLPDYQITQLPDSVTQFYGGLGRVDERVAVFLSARHANNTRRNHSRAGNDAGDELLIDRILIAAAASELRGKKLRSHVAHRETGSKLLHLIERIAERWQVHTVGARVEQVRGRRLLRLRIVELDQRADRLAVLRPECIVERKGSAEVPQHD